MSESSITFHGLEDYSEQKDRRRDIIVLFNTDRHGIYQVEYTKLKDGWKLKSLPQEPNLQMFSKAEQYYIEKVCRIVWRLVHETPAAKARFDRKP